jgi:histidinol dehydrogenase
MRVLSTTNRRDRAAIARVMARDAARDTTVRRQASRIIADVRRRGDAAVREWTRTLDGASGPVEVGAAELRAGWRATPRDVRDAVKLAAANIRRVAEAQRPRPFSVTPVPGVRVDQRVSPLARVGCYVPGGRYPLPSTLLMTVIPARVAGVAEVIVACPRPGPVVLCAALEAGATRLLRIGGAQAIAALAYGTRTIPPVDKIVGPGNAWVAAAKALVSADCAIDLHAGPSEIAIYSDRMPASWIAADLIAQAEHDPHARAIFITTRAPLAAAVTREIDSQVRETGPARVSLASHGAIIVARSRDEAIALVNRIAPEHAVCDAATVARALTSAGTIFVGRWSAQASGDYTTGSNHVLPTGGAARVRGGLGAADFMRTFTVQTLTRDGIAAIGRAAAALADAEGLTAHAASIRARFAS